MSNTEIPKDINPENFFTQYLPARFEENKSSIPEEALSVNADVTFELTGSEGGLWTIVMESGNFSVVQGEVPDRTVKIVQTVDDWQGAIRSEKGFRLELPGKDDGNDQSRGLVINQEKIDKLKAVSGSIKFQLKDQEKGNWEITAVFGSKPHTEPTCTISMNAGDATAMRKGELNPQTAFMSGKINIQGDIGLAMQIGTALMT